MRITKGIYCGLWMVLVSFQGLHGQFVDVTALQGIDNINENTFDGNGISFYDFNRDGWDDLTIANGSDAPLFLVNDSGKFVPADINLPIDPVAHVVMILWADYDNDGDSDLLTTQLGGTLDLWNNDGAYTFTEVSNTAGLDNGNWDYWGAAFCDYDHDGCLDLYVAKYYDDDVNDVDPNHRARLYHSNCDGTFTDVTLASGVLLAPRAVFQPVFFDYDHDGWEDLFLVIDRNAWTNELYRNNQNGTFSKVTIAVGLNQAFDSMTGTVNDFDNDGDMDIYVTNGYPGNKLYQHNSDDTFTNIAASAGVTVNLICWASLWLDYDNDSWQDLFVGTTGNFYGPVQNDFFINNKNNTFTLDNNAVGLTGDLSPTMVASMGDINNDGYYDFITNNNDPYPTVLWQNDGGDKHYLGVSLEGTVSNREGIGSWIRCYAGGHSYARYSKCGEDLAGQNSGKYIFGLDTIAVVDSLVIDWNMGTHDVFYGVPVDQHLHILEGSSPLDPIQIYTSDDLVLCPGDSLTLEAPPGFFSYTWNTGDTTQTITVSEAGEYWLAATGSFGLTNSNLINLEALDSAVVQVQIHSVSCNSGSDGQLSLSVPGQEIATVNWNTGDSGIILDSLTAGMYSFSGMITAGCLFSGQAIIEEPEALQWIIETTNVSCYGQSDGDALVTLLNAETESILWSSGDENLHITSLMAGTYYLDAVTTDGCPIIDSVTITQPEQLSLLIEYSDALCNGESDGTAEVEISGGFAPYLLDWGGALPSQLSAGNYPFTITDSVGCTVQFVVTIGEPEELNAGITTSMVLCHGESNGWAEVEPVGGTSPWTVDWYGADPEYLAAGIFPVQVTDSRGCIWQGDIEITEPEILDVNLVVTNAVEFGTPGSAMAEVEGGTEPYTIVWNIPGGGSTAFVDGLEPGNYSVLVTDNQECSVEQMFDVLLLVGVETVSSPGDLSYDELSSTVVFHRPFDQALVFNRLGQLVVRWSGYSEYSLRSLSPALYTILVRWTDGTTGMYPIAR